MSSFDDEKWFSVTNSNSSKGNALIILLKYLKGNILNFKFFCVLKVMKNTYLY